MPSAATRRRRVEMGIPVKGVLVSTYVISGLCAGIGAVVLAGRTGAELAALRQPARARHHRRRDHRRRELPRRPRPYRPRPGRRGDDRRDPQCPEPAQRRRLLPDDRHRPHHRGRGRGRCAAQPSRGAGAGPAGGEGANDAPASPRSSPCAMRRSASAPSMR